LRQIGAARIDATYFCPDPPGVPSTRRKPEPGMVLEAAAAYDIDLARSYFIGDKSADIACGQRAGTRTILVLTGYGAEQDCHPDFTAHDVVQAVEMVAQHGFHKSPRKRTDGGIQAAVRGQGEDLAVCSRKSGRSRNGSLRKPASVQ